MKFKEYWLRMSRRSRVSFAERCDTTVGHLNNIAYGCRSFSVALAVNVERESGGEVPCEKSLPHVDWAYLRGSTKSPSALTSRKSA